MSLDTEKKQTSDFYLNNIINTAFKENHPNPFWKFIRSKRYQSAGIAPLKDGSLLHIDSQSKADTLNSQFTSVFNIEDPNAIPVPFVPYYPSNPDFIVKVCVVQMLFHNVKPNKASRPGDIPCSVLKEAAHELAPAPADIFNSSLSLGTFPEDWRKAHVAPV